MKQVLQRTRRVWQCFQQDHCLLHASDIAFATLFALIPMMVLAFSFLKVFGILHSYQEMILRLLYQKFFLQNDLKVQEQMNLFFEKGFEMDVLGILAFIVLSVLWLRTIEASFNTIQQIKSPRSLFVRLPVYWTLITLAPLAMLLSIGLSYFLINFAGEYKDMLELFVAYIMPFCLSFSVVFALNKTLPHRSPGWVATLWGAFVTSVLWEIAKIIFTYYTTHLANYGKLYGVFGAIFSFLFWLYITWAVFLFGAEVVRELDREPGKSVSP